MRCDAQIADVARYIVWATVLSSLQGPMITP